ncbi:hypothetical protein LXL04_010651 [Taraxacum kok-saghyz]
MRNESTRLTPLSIRCTPVEISVFKHKRNLVFMAADLLQVAQIKEREVLDKKENSLIWKQVAIVQFSKWLFLKLNQSADVKKQTVFFLQTADVWSSSSAAEGCRCGPQTADGDWSSSLHYLYLQYLCCRPLLFRLADRLRTRSEVWLFDKAQYEVGLGPHLTQLEIDRFQMKVMWREIRKCARDEVRGSTDMEIDRFGTFEESEPERKEVWRSTDLVIAMRETNEREEVVAM